eukprot:gnl/TRDRNA2_/TRDRNA2_74131_c0_seq1.p1 gnl/TRDRNA2_/TRDRNA2_74131_c0~~gnl/TRDRNA2_/TRDRNA2_74131_c0_seq1.p1  ORF type:complete len:343 (+),score=23.88 gnl/TRDRNA2_/TRDRNA2_74131_c0_seq1:80-1108(+)
MLHTKATIAARASTAILLISVGALLVFVRQDSTAVQGVLKLLNVSAYGRSYDSAKSRVSPTTLRARMDVRFPSFGAYEIGHFDFNHLFVTVRQGTRVYPGDIAARANQSWAAKLQKMPNLFDGPVWSLISHEVRESDGGQQLHIAVQQSSFKYQMYTHFSEDALLLPKASRCNGCTLLALTETLDGFILLGRRSMKVGQMPGYWHAVPSGNVDSPNIAGVLEKELLEETGTTWDEVKQAQLLALLDCGAEQGHKVEFAFHISLKLTAAQVFQRCRSAEDRNEHDSFIFVGKPGCIPPSGPPVPIVAVDEFLRNGSYRCTDVSRRALLLYFSSSGGNGGNSST